MSEPLLVHSDLFYLLNCYHFIKRRNKNGEKKQKREIIGLVNSNNDKEGEKPSKPIKRHVLPKQSEARVTARRSTACQKRTKEKREENIWNDKNTLERLEKFHEKVSTTEHKALSSEILKASRPINWRQGEPVASMESYHV